MLPRVLRSAVPVREGVVSALAVLVRVMRRLPVGEMEGVRWRSGFRRSQWRAWTTVESGVVGLWR
jgi:hypothetical protein